MRDSANRHTCPYCTYSAPFPSKVKRHINNRHSEIIYERCTPDSVPSACPRDVHSKVSSAGDVLRLMCPHCDFITSDLEDFNSHLMNVHERGILCPMPDCTIHVLLGDLENHLHSVHGQSDVSEEYVGVQELDSTSCSSMPAPISKRLASCTTASISECASTSNNSDDLPSDGDEPDVHDKAYSQYRRTRKYVCNWEGCGKAFATNGLLEDHLNYHKGPPMAVICAKDNLAVDAA
ncbi:zinc finger, C2H2 type [Ostertagia ostertagi]